MATGPSRHLTLAEHLARFAALSSYDDLSEPAREQLKIRLLDSLACAIAALDGAPVRLVRAQVTALDASGPCSLVGGGSATPDRAAFYNAALVRYLDFNDCYLAAGESCHPSDSLGAVLAAAEYAGASGRDFLVALALAYQVQCRLSDVAPVREAGFDHVTQGAYAVAAGSARALGLDATRTAHAIAIAGAAFNALRVTRTGALSHWKGLAAPHVAGAVLRTTLLAGRGITGPLEVFEGDKGFMDAVAGGFELDWDAENLERVTATILRKHNAEVHAQSVIEAVLALRAREGVRAADVARVEISVFDVAYRIIGGGEEGEKTVVRTKEEADHSLPYLVAVALLDGQVMPEQFRPARIRAADVQALLQRVSIRPDEGCSRRFPAKVPCRVTMVLRGGRELTAELAEYPGPVAGGPTWEATEAKFNQLTAPYTSPALRARILTTVTGLDEVPATTLTHLLRSVGPPGATAATPSATA
ncbi:MAG TPA: MmgE/PrpD family protein [Gemmatimonadales bacterium]|nr:MmgE/PrpD family protein [Gemmatimonadales bacterium]